MRSDLLDAYRCPRTHTALIDTGEGLQNAEGRIYPYLGPRARFPDFVGSDGAKGLYEKFDAQTAAKLDYATAAQVEIYQNEIDWLMQTFGADETGLRRSLMERLGLQNGDRLLVVGCGQGAELPLYLQQVGQAGAVYAQDISASMIDFAAAAPANAGVEFCVSDAGELPYQDAFFDAVIQVGAINQFSDVAGAIAEMSRVTRIGGRILICDEGMAPHLLDTDYGRRFTTNNPLWATAIPLADLPDTAQNVELSFVLGLCFYVIRFERSDGPPPVDWEVAHKGWRGGNVESRYAGQLEGVRPETRERVIAAARSSGLSVHDWLETALSKALDT